MSTATLPQQGAGIAALEISADTLTPVAAALRLRDRLAFILESVEGGARYGRYSFVGVRGRTVVIDGDEAVVWGPDYAELERFPTDDPLEALRRVLPPGGNDPSFPFPMAAGVGYLSYEASARWERLPVPAADPIGLPEALFHIPDVVIAFDHLAQTATLATADTPGAHARLASVTAQLAKPVPDEAPRPVRHASERRRVRPPERDPRYETGVAELVREIRAGEMLQAVLARRFTFPAAAPALEIYRALRRINPSPHLFAIDLGPGRSILGASPELLVRVRDGEVVTRPIAGTRPRSEDPVRDAQLEADLLADEKELAEHAMLVDLARNDVGRIAEVGSVEWPVLYAIERFSHVMHISSEVRGRLRAGKDAFDAVRSTFPAGTLSGAQKVRAMESIARLEAEKRGPYGGAVGFFSPTDVEAAITIRSVVLRDGVAYVTAGAGIVADSVPETESAEVAAKAAAVLAALGEAEAALEGGRVMTATTQAKRILLIDNYDSFTWNLYQLIAGMGADVDVVRNDAITVDEVAARDYDAIVLSPGPSRPEKAGICVDLVRRLGATTPMLGVCLGHQAMGVAYGGNVVTVEPVHGKRSLVDHGGLGVFAGLPSPLTGARYHSLVVERTSLPAELEVTAWSADGLVMGMRHRSHPVQGIQFHPESILTEEGPALVRGWLAGIEVGSPVG